MKKEVGVLVLNDEDKEIYIAGYNPSTAGIVIPSAEEVPEIFDRKQAEYLFALTGHSILRDLKGELLNIVESIGLGERQETAVKRMVTNSLHGWHRRFKEDIEIVTKSE